MSARELFAIPVVSLIVEDITHKNILIQKRKKKGLYENYWELPQGKIRRGETIDSCARRELFEETGLVNFVMKTKIKENKGIFVFNSLIVSDPFELSYIACCVVGSAEGKLRNTDEACDHKWVSKNITTQIVKIQQFFPLNVEMIKYYWSTM